MSDGATADPKARHLIYGVHRASGRAAGEYINVTYNAEQYAEQVGVDGEGYWSANANLSARITCALLASSDTNDIFSALFLADLAAPGGLLLPLVVREANGRTLWAASRARIVKFADGVWSDGTEVRTWVFSTTRLTGFIGGMSPTPLNPNP